MKLWNVVVVLGLICASLGVWAQPESQRLLNFKKWKQDQVSQAENQVVRLSNRLHILRSGYFKLLDRGTPESSAAAPVAGELDSQKRRELKQTESDLATLESQVQSALENLQFSKELTLDEYVAVYLKPYRDNPEAIKRLAKSLSKDEVAELLQAVLKAQGDRSDDKGSDEKVKTSVYNTRLSPRSSARAL